MKLPDPLNRMTWTQILSELVDGIVAFLATIGMVIGFVSIMVIMTGCGSTGSEVRAVVEQGAETVEAGEDAARSGEGFIQEVGEAAEEGKKTGQKLRGLRSKRFTLELAKSKSLDGVQVRVRPVGGDQHQTIPDGDFAEYTLKVSRFAESANFSIYTEINGTGRALKVSKEYFNDQQDGPAEILVLTEVRENEFAWLPPSERDGDETIRFDGN